VVFLPEKGGGRLYRCNTCHEVCFTNGRIKLQREKQRRSDPEKEGKALGEDGKGWSRCVPLVKK